MNMIFVKIFCIVFVIGVFKGFGCVIVVKFVVEGYWVVVNYFSFVCDVEDVVFIIMCDGGKVVVVKVDVCDL